MPELNDRLIELKKNKNLLQKDIAKAVGLSLRSYQRYERGERFPDTIVLKSFANYFQVSTDYLLGLSDDPTRH